MSIFSLATWAAILVLGFGSLAIFAVLVVSIFRNREN